MDALDKEIRAKRAKRDKLKDSLRELEVEITALERAASLRPNYREEAESDEQSRESWETMKRIAQAEAEAESGIKTRAKVKGRRPGDISHTWREILEELYRLGSPQSYNDIANAALILGHELQLASVRDRVRSLVKAGFMDGNPDAGFIVTNDAAERFGFAKENEPSEGGSDDNAEGAQTPSAFELQPSPDGA